MCVYQEAKKVKPQEILFVSNNLHNLCNIKYQQNIRNYLLLSVMLYKAKPILMKQSIEHLWLERMCK